MKRLIGTLALVLATTLTATGCGSDGTNNNGNDNNNNSSTSASSKHNNADVEFLTGMVPHHQQAVQMAAMAKTNASSAQVRSLARKIEAAQGPEIEKMQAWLEDWDEKPSDSGSDMAGMDHGSGGGMAGMMTKQDMGRLEAAAGTAFDRMWLTMMAEHHRGAVAAAKTEQRDGENPEVKALAKKIEADQTAEIAEIEKLLDT